MTEKQLFYPLLSVYFSLILGDLQKEKLQIVSIFRFGHKKRGLFQCPPEGERLLAGHDAEHHVVGGTHRLLAYAGKVAYGAVYVGVDDALGAGHKLALARQQG